MASLFLFLEMIRRRGFCNDADFSGLVLAPSATPNPPSPSEFRMAAYLGSSPISVGRRFKIEGERPVDCDRE
jgi:hypothetical protein